MATIAVAKIGALLKIGEREFEVYEGDIVNDLVYTEGGQEKTITGAVRVICASTKAQNADPETCPPDPYVKKYINCTRLIIDYSEENKAKLTRINISNIVGLGSVTVADAADGSVLIGTGSQYKTLDAVLADVEDGATVKLEPGEYEVPLNINKSVTIIGNAPGVTLTGKISVAAEAAPAVQSDDAVKPAGIKVEISNVKLTGDATVDVGAGVDELSITECVFGGHNLTAKTMPIQVQHNAAEAAPMVLRIENNVFEAENEHSYNLIDVYAKLKTGSCISGNKFLDKCCAHNQISLYGIEDGATILIEDNYAYRSANMVRIGFIGTPLGTVVMNRNSYTETDTDPAWAGLFLVQPYGNKTDSFAGLQIDVNDTEMPCGQLGYVFAQGKDTPFTTSNKPTIYVNGTATEVPNLSPAPAAPAV